ILNSMITTSIDKDYGEIDPDEKVSIIFHEFTGKQAQEPLQHPLTKIKLWLYLLVGLLLLALIGVIVFIILRRRKQADIIMEETHEEEPPAEVPDLMEGEISEVDIRRKQLEKMARE